MKQFGTILSFELKSYMKNKVFVGVTLFFVAVIVAVMFWPRISDMIDLSDDAPAVEDVGSGPTADGSDGTADSGDGSASSAEDRPVMLIGGKTENTDLSMLASSFSAAFTDNAVRLSEDSEEDIKSAVESGEAECAFVFDSDTSYTYYVDNLSMYDDATFAADEILKNMYFMGAMVGAGVSTEEAQSIMSAEITHESVPLGKDQMQNFFYTYIMIFALYMVILMYGQMVATNVATEKSSRAMELLITSAKPTAMMFGKITASCIAGLIQLICIFGSAVLCFKLNGAYWGDNMIINSIFNMPVDLFIYMLMFFVLGFLIYAFMYGAVGSTASKLEDINTSVMPITLMFIAAFMVVMFSMTSGNVDNIAMKICSYIPFTSPMAMFTRIAMSTVAAYEIIISALILIASVFAVGVLAARIYRAGVLMYGTTPKPAAVLKLILRKK